MLGWKGRHLLIYLLGFLHPSLAVDLIRIVARWRGLL
jgi:hypothetical protein